MRFTRLHMKDIPVYVSNTRMIHCIDVLFCVCYCMAEADLFYPDRLYSSLDLMLDKKIRNLAQSQNASLKFGAIICIGSANSARDDQHIFGAHCFSKFEFPLYVINRSLTLDRVDAGEIIVPRKHAADASDFKLVLPEYLECLFRSVAKILTVVISVKLYPLHTA